MKALLLDADDSYYEDDGGFGLSPRLKIMGWLAAGVMTAAAVALLITSFI